MKTVTILSNVIEPRPASCTRARFVGKVLKAGSTVPLEDDQAKALIDAGNAVEGEAPQPEKPAETEKPAEKSKKVKKPADVA